MAQMTRVVVLATLKRDNPGVSAGDLAMYADSFMDYAKAQANIDEHGTIVAHPRTGQPIENPFCRIKSAAMQQLLKFRHLRVGALWR